MNIRRLALLVAALCIAAASAFAQSDSASHAALKQVTISDPPMTDPSAAEAPARATMSTRPWEYGPFFQGGSGIGDRANYKFTAAGLHLGKVLTPQVGRSIFRGQFELAGEIMPYWQAFTPPQGEQPDTCYDPASGLTLSCLVLMGGGAFTGVSVTPAIFRWDFKPGRRIAPWFQAAGGVIYTTHKFPPDVLVPHGLPGGTSVWNFCPQGGIGFHYFLRPGRSIDIAASGVHISSASLGDHNPGVNASVMFQIGYTFFGKKF